MALREIMAQQTIEQIETVKELSSQTTSLSPEFLKEFESAKSYIKQHSAAIRSLQEATKQQSITEFQQESEQTDKISEAMAKAQGSFGTPQRSRGRNYGGYSTLGDMIDVSQKALSENGLWTSFPRWQDKNKEQYIGCKIRHSSGQWVLSYMPFEVEVGRNGKMQSTGGTMTYSKRYLYASTLGLSDSDAEGCEEEQEKESGEE